MAEPADALQSLVDIPENPVPKGAKVGSVATSDGVAIRYARFPAATGPARGTVLVLPGRAEFIEKYFETARDLTRRGYAVVSLDWRGQGGSQRLLRNRMKGHVESFADYGRDLRAVHAEVVLPDCPPPYWVLAHSMGATVALLNAAYLRSQVSNLVLSAPLFGIRGRDSARLQRLASLLAYCGLSEAFVPGGSAAAVQAIPFAGNVVTSDPRRYERTRLIVEAEPRLALGAATVGWVNAAARAMAEASTSAVRDLRLPMLVLLAGGERLVSNAAIETFARHAKMAALVTIPGAEHEVLMERDALRDQAFAAIDSFLDVEARAA